jgi:hypothetical protein
VVHTCNSSYAGGIGRKIAVWGLPWEKMWGPLQKLTQKELGGGWGCGSVVDHMPSKDLVNLAEEFICLPRTTLQVTGSHLRGLCQGVTVIDCALEKSQWLWCELEAGVSRHWRQEGQPGKGQWQQRSTLALAHQWHPFWLVSTFVKCFKIVPAFRDYCLVQTRTFHSWTKAHPQRWQAQEGLERQL